MTKSEALNMDFSQRLVIKTSEMPWEDSPHELVKRKKLEREDAETGHATSIVRYLPGAHFKSHPHPQGEEIFVLDGIFSDEYGDYPSGTYIRNPPNFSHAPFSKDGCEILVKLNQFHPEDLGRVIIKTNDPSGWRLGHGGLEVYPLHSFITEGAALVKWPEHEVFQPHRHYGGEEIFVLKGTFKDQYGSYPVGTWIRNPHLSSHHPFVDEETIIFVKTGHLLSDTNSGVD